MNVTFGGEDSKTLRLYRLCDWQFCKDLNITLECSGIEPLIFPEPNLRAIFNYEQTVWEEVFLRRHQANLEM
jgi:hypothetical protein